MRPPRRSCRREKPCDTGEGPFWKREIEGGYVRRRSVTQVAPSSAVENSVVPVRPSWVASIVPVVSRGTQNPMNPLRSEEHTSELQSRGHLVCRLLLDKNKQKGE